MLPDIPLLLERACADLVVAAAAGELTQEQADALTSGSILSGREFEPLRALPTEAQRNLLRLHWSERVSWCVFSAPWLDSLATLLHALLGQTGQRRVVEVCAGGGILVGPMRSRGLDWLATDIKPRAGGAASVAEAGALDAVRSLAPCICFWSWWSNKAMPSAPAPCAVNDGDLDSDAAPMPEDFRVVEYCMQHQIPVVFVGESEGGLTGSAALWRGPWSIQTAGEVMATRPPGGIDAEAEPEPEAPTFVDVPRWTGFNDRTFVILPPRAARTAPQPHISWMQYAPADYGRLLREKEASVRRRFAAHLGGGSLRDFAVFASAPSGFRQRARFAIVRVDGRMRYALYDRGTPSVIVDDFPIASKEINLLMPSLLAALESSAPLSASLSAIKFLATQSGDMLVTLIYAAPLDADWRREAEGVRIALGIPALVGRAKGESIVLERDWVSEVLGLADGRRLTYRQVEGSFSNPSAAMAEHTLNFLCTCAADASAALASSRAGNAAPNLLELYCGNGHHTAALAPIFRRVLAVELDARLADAATQNLELNGVANVSILRADSAKFCARLLRRIRSAVAARGATGEAGRQRPAPDEADSDQPSQEAWLREACERTDVILVDPPRKGLDPETLCLASSFEHILYVSCNPDALLADLEASLGATHEVRRLALFDHFAYTHHLEVAVHLGRRC